MSLCDVLVVGAGPVGLILASELVRHRVSCRIIDKLHQPSRFCRAIGITPRTLEVLDDMGLALEFIDHGLRLTGRRSIIAHQPPVDQITPPYSSPYSSLGVPQNDTERILTQHLHRQGLNVERGVQLTALSAGEDAVQAQLLHLNSGELSSASCRFLIGCDGAHSTVRHQLNIAFDGDAIPASFKLCDVHVVWSTPVPRGMSVMVVHPELNAPPQMFVAIPLPDPHRYRVTLLNPQSESDHSSSANAAAASTVVQHGIQSETAGPTLEELQVAVDAIVDEKPRLSDLRWSSVFRISMRLAQRYRSGRVFLAGDAAHIHPPTGGQGMNTGIQDGYNLAWKLALVLGGASPMSLLESYEGERRPVGADVVQRTTSASFKMSRGENEASNQRSIDAQLSVSYRDTQWVCQQAGISATPPAGDRAPDVGGLTRTGINFPSIRGCIKTSRTESCFGRGRRKAVAIILSGSLCV